ncbi:NAD(P)H-hydrate dehydratase [Marininema halotolerans]|uniref:Bifunctional NAD(P)H-hydrate repair enzyme n=1 Tax=Marininema halotolerans TaxID=1155944 RepID=A0A1I6TJR0_9BACL|nr:NAD(P)H-hydrate dehydratase [Marininema halotolerans]SFS89463.1 NAD(P)H-hydrate epimerase [Marininema halotolerans]
MHLYTAQEMRDLDQYTIQEVGIPGVVLMENAGRMVTEEILRRHPHPGRAVILTGGGNNGGDGFVIARLLWGAGWDVSVWITGTQEKMSAETATNYHVCRRLQLPMEHFTSDKGDSLSPLLQQADVVVDALLGTGVKGPLRPPYGALIERVNRDTKGWVLAVDTPSGVETDNGSIETIAIRADVTVSLVGPKWCHYLRPGAEYVGELVIADIGIPKEVARKMGTSARLNGPEEWKEFFLPRSRWSHKGTHGHLLVLGGSKGMLGAVKMSGVAAYRTGVGLVTLGVPESQLTTLGPSITEALLWGWPEDELGQFGNDIPVDWRERSNRFKAMAIGPGLGKVSNGQEWIRQLLQGDHPIVLDADGLNLLALDPSLLKERSAPTILTPHPGEMARLLNTSVQEVERFRPEVAKEWAHTYGVTVVLKGSHTVIATPDGRQWVQPKASPALAKAGSGDVLTGIIGALLARGWTSATAALAGVWLHNSAGELAVTSSSHSVLATDVIQCIGDAIQLID